MANNTDNKQLPAQAENTVPATLPETDDNNGEAELLLAGGRFDNLNLAADLTSLTSSYCSMVAADNKAKVTLYNACNQPEKLSAHINEQIKVQHVYIEIIQVISKVTGEVTKAPRIVLIGHDGKGYQAVSVGIYNAVKQMLLMFGDPATWSAPHTVKVVNIPLEGGFHTFTLQLVD